MYKGNFLKGEENKDLAYKLSTIKTEENANAKLLITIQKYEKAVNRLDIILAQNQFDALVSFVYNLGINSITTSTLLKRVKSGKGDIMEAFKM
jgi:GH24 family phage-related lysozyme (muramidase)